MERRKIPGRAIGIATILVMVVFGAGYAVASLTITNATETANGAYTNPSTIAGWSQSSTAIAYMPTGLTAASTTVGTPSVLPSTAQSYSVGSVTAGDVAQILKFAETSSAAANTEIEITFTLSTASQTTTTVYVETQGTTVAQTFTFYLDAGSAASASVTINFVAQAAMQCSAVGTCP